MYRPNHVSGCGDRSQDGNPVVLSGTVRRVVDNLLLVGLSLVAGVAIGSHPRVAALVAVESPVARLPQEARHEVPHAASDEAPSRFVDSVDTALAAPRDVPADALPGALSAFEEQLKQQLQQGGLRLDPAASLSNAGLVVSFLSGLRLPDLPIRQDPRVARYVRFFTSTDEGRQVFRGWLSRRPRYHELIERALRDRALPSALEAVVFVESGLFSQALSQAGARGLWQLMPGTARKYGLTVEPAVDERTDPVRSTDAAVRHLVFLQGQLGSWDLVLAAYNAGMGAVADRMQQAGVRDFWGLEQRGVLLPEETRLYVPKVQAVAVILANLEAFGFDSPPAIDDSWVPAMHAWPRAALEHEGATGGGVFSRLLSSGSELSAVPLEVAPSPHEVLGYSWGDEDTDAWGWGGVRPSRPVLPSGSELPAAPPSTPSASPSSTTYRVAPGDTLSEIASRHGITLRQLVRDNGIDDPAVVQIGRLLRIDGVAGEQSKPEK